MAVIESPACRPTLFRRKKTIRIPTALSTASRSTTVVMAVKNIVHRVEKEKPFTALARKYNVSQDDLYRANPGLSTNLKSNQEINIPLRTNIAEARANQQLLSNDLREKLQVCVWVCYSFS
jgi:LysM repeat protein